ncbi:MAG TPA: hypothetical protein DEQ61_19480 [Streptomyces sp.]|nr:hypothetical protein [Streptomyces sp.]
MRNPDRARAERVTVAALCIAAAVGLTAHGARNDGPDTIRFPHSEQQSPGSAPPAATASGRGSG